MIYLVALFGLAAASDEKKFSNNHNGWLDEDLSWFNAGGHSPKIMMEKIKTHTGPILHKYFDVVIGDPASGDAKFMYKVNDRHSRYFAYLQNSMAKQANKCNNLTGTSKEVSRKRRDDEERGVFADGQFTNAISDFWSIFWHHAAFIRETLIQNPECNQNRAMAMLRRVDRMRFTMIWNYCRHIDNSFDECSWIERKADGSKRKHPRKWADLSEGGKYSHAGPDA